MSLAYPNQVSASTVMRGRLPLIPPESGLLVRSASAASPPPSRAGLNWGDLSRSPDLRDFTSSGVGNKLR